MKKQTIKKTDQIVKKANTVLETKTVNKRNDGGYIWVV
jgi:hypothetical protein